MLLGGPKTDMWPSGGPEFHLLCGIRVIYGSGTIAWNENTEVPFLLHYFKKDIRNKHVYENHND